MKTLVYLLLYIFVGTQKEGKAKSLNNFLETFRGCLVHIINYQEANLKIDSATVVISGGFQSTPIRPPGTEDNESRHFEGHGRRSGGLGKYSGNMRRLTYQYPVPWKCVAQLYLFPTKSNAAPIRDPYDYKMRIGLDIPEPFASLWGNPRGSSWLDEIYSSINRQNKGRYHILVTKREPEIFKLWIETYKEILVMQSVPMDGIIVTVQEDRSPFSGSIDSLFEFLRITKLQVVNRFRLFEPQGNLVPENVVNTLWTNGYERYEIDNALLVANDIRNNPGVHWILQKEMSRGMLSRDPYGDNSRMSEDDILALISASQFQASQYIQSIFQRGHSVPMDSANRFKGSENLVFALMVLGSNISICCDRNEMLSQSAELPTIFFGSEKSRYFDIDPPQHFKFITCSPQFKVRVSKLEAFIMAFDYWTWLYIGVFYIVAPLLLALLYHGIVKKRVKKPHLRYTPFTMAAKALVNQSGDRLGNSKRFGFMACFLVPSHLMAIVLNYAYRGENIRILNSPQFTYWPFASPRALIDYNITIYTDQVATGMKLLRKDENFTMAYGFSPNERSIAEFLISNKAAAYASWENQIDEIEKEIWMRSWDGTRSTTGYGGFHINKWQYMTTKQAGGWRLELWCDNLIIPRIDALLQSGIPHKWKELLRNEPVGRSWSATVATFVKKVSLSSNIVNLFKMGLFGCCGAAAIFIFELLWYLIYTRHKRNHKKVEKKAMMKLDLEKETYFAQFYEQQMEEPVEIVDDTNGVIERPA